MPLLNSLWRSPTPLADTCRFCLLSREEYNVIYVFLYQDSVSYGLLSHYITSLIKYLVKDGGTRS